MNLREWLIRYKLWAESRLPVRLRTRLACLLKLNEEVGELNRAALREGQAELEAELGDVFVTWLGVCASRGLDPLDVAVAAFKRIEKRDYRKGVKLQKT